VVVAYLKTSMEELRATNINISQAKQSTGYETYQQSQKYEAECQPLIRESFVTIFQTNARFITFPSTIHQYFCIRLSTIYTSFIIK
jgi:hypothetical protein